MRRIETESDRLCLVLEIKVDELRHYLDAVKLQLEEMADNYEKGIEVTAQQFSDKQERQRFYEFSNEESWTYRNTLDCTPVVGQIGLGRSAGYSRFRQASAGVSKLTGDRYPNAECNLFRLYTSSTK